MDIRNSPYFIESWQNSLIKLNDGRVLEGIKTRFNINNFSVHFTTDEKVQMFFPPELVKELDIYEKTETKNIMYKFKTGFPKVDNLDQNSFYQVLSEGTISLLKSIRKNLVVNKNDISGEVEKQFIFYENYYLFSNNKMIRLKKDKDFILKLVSAKKDKIEEFMKDHPTNFKNIADLVSLVNFYNAL
ncbi:MAG TPA: hypothetical protein VMY77_17875 [Chitinophagaceae bacterium]|nr:hypothetical protein [Chitinophagaceae bacterium]